MKIFVFTFVIVFSVKAFPQSENACGEDETGVSRKPGDSWQEDCNRCRCLMSGIPGCTKKFCGGIPNLFEPQVCKDSLGNSREEGEEWVDGPQSCSCGGGLTICANVTEEEGVKKNQPIPRRGAVNFPGSSKPRAGAGTCLDAARNERSEGESWKEDCNTCRCTSNGVTACTEIFCGDVDKDDTTPALFEEDPTQNVINTVQCRQEGVKNCRAVTLNMDYLQTSVKPGDFIEFLDGTNVSMKLRRAPSGSSSATLSYSFSLSDGGEGTVTVRPNNDKTVGPSVYASVKPVTGNIMYTVESCGQGCNVVYERDSGYFNQFQD